MYRIIEDDGIYFVQEKVLGLFWMYEISISENRLRFDTQEKAEKFVEKLLNYKRNRVRVVREYK